jgi:CheY-like chemotaxis protein
MPANQKSVLVVDDEPAVRNLVHALLTQIGHRVEMAGNAQEALGKIENHEFDLVFTDFLMPGMKGDELAREIRKRRPGMPVVLLTGRHPEHSSPEISRVLAKPFSRDDLHETIRALT